MMWNKKWFKSGNIQSPELECGTIKNVVVCIVGNNVFLRINRIPGYLLIIFP